MLKSQQFKFGVVVFLLGSLMTSVLVALATCLFAYRHGVLLPRRGAWTGLEYQAGGAQLVGPWGTVEAARIPLANPGGMLPDQAQRFQETKWTFNNASECRVSRFLKSCGLRPFEERLLLDKRCWNIRSNQCVISPPESVIWSLGSASRERIYSALAKSSENYPQRFPFHFPLDGLVAYLENCGLNVQTAEKISALTYTNSNSACFADLPTVRKSLAPEAFNDLLALLYEIPAYTLRLHVSPGSDIDALVRYWGKGGREKRITPLLKALAKVPGGAPINIGYLMPPFARLRLYTYPDSWDDPTAPRQDCFFTSMNFFNEVADTNFFDANYAQEVLASKYSSIHGDPVFGDVITLMNSDDQVIHVCVYIAADFVFTKNGINSAQPWVLMKMADMLGVYCAPRKIGRMLILRPNDGSESAGAHLVGE